jgi:uncharacterized protein YdhG (YjbR/CyaY superfamily)
MQSKAQSVDEYLKEVPPARLSALNSLRKLCKDILEGYKESMAYGMPSYKNNEQVVIAFASQKQHICFYVLKHEVMINNKELILGLNHGKGCIRYSNPDKIDFEIVKKLLHDSYASKADIC